MIRKWDITDKEVKQLCSDEVIARINAQGDAEFGVIATQEVIDIVAEHLGPQVYNQAINDAKRQSRKR